MVKKTADSLLIGYDCSNGKDKTVLIVGRKPLNKPVEIINAFQGDEAEKLWEKLTTKVSR